MIETALPFVTTMELLKLYMLAAFMFKALGLPLPWLATAASFLAAMTLGWTLRLAGGRSIWRALFQLLGLALSLLALYRAGLGSSWNSPADRRLLLAASLDAACWIRGAWLAKSTLTHAFCLSRFEEGIAVYLAVFFISISTGADPANALGLSLAFFLCGILALGVSKARNAAEGGFSRRPRGAPLALVTGSFLLAAVGLFFTTQELQRSAEKARNALKAGALEFIHRLGELLDTLFTTRRTAAAAQAGRDVLYRMAGNESGAESPIAQVLLTAFIVVVAAGLLMLALVLLSWTLRALRALATEKTEPADLSFVPAWLRAFIRGCARFILRLLALKAARLKKATAAGAAYARLLACGRAGGCPRRPTETAREYTRRLAAIFPRAARQAGFIARALEQEIYGGKRLDASATARLIAARGSLHPYWFSVERFRRPPTTTRRPS